MDVEMGRGEPAKTYATGEIELEPLFAEDVDSITMNNYPAFVIYKMDGLYGI